MYYYNLGNANDNTNLLEVMWSKQEEMQNNLQYFMASMTDKLGIDTIKLLL